MPTDQNEVRKALGVAEVAYKAWVAEQGSGPLLSVPPPSEIWIAGYIAAASPTAGAEGPDDARHVSVDHGRRTLCGKPVKGDTDGRYLPLGEAPRADEGGAWCWTCLTVQDEAYALAARPEPSEAEVEAAAKSLYDGATLESMDELRPIARRLLIAARAVKEDK